MPETAVNEDDRAVFRKRNIWGSRKAAVINPVTETHLPESMAKFQLRLCGSGVDGGHVAMALFRRKDVRHLLRYTYAKIHHLNCILA